MNNKSDFKIEIIRHNQNYYKELILMSSLIISAIFIDGIGLWISLFAIGIIALTLLYNLTGIKSKTIDYNLLDDSIIKENSNNFRFQHNEEWDLEFVKLDESVYKDYYRLWNNLTGSKDKLFKIRGLKPVLEDNQNIFTNFIEFDGEYLLLQKLNIYKYKLNSNLIVMQNNTLIINEKIGLYKLYKFSENVIKGVNGSNKIEIKLK